MKKTWISLFLLLAINLLSAGQVRVTELRTEHLNNPMGLGEQKPCLSWILEATSDAQRGITQHAYEIIVKSGKEIVWKTGKTESSVSTGIIYQGEPLRSNTRYQWKVRVWDNTGRVSPWSHPAGWHTGLFDTGEWKARWIEPDGSDDRAACFRKVFQLSGPVAEAVLYITAHGVYSADVNGKKVSEDLLTPGWTSYHKRLQYQCYDIATQVQQGQNAIGVTVAKGWYLSKFHKNSYGNDYGLLAQIMVRYKDGSSEIIVTDDSWRCSTGEISYPHLYDGETIDLNKRNPGWNTARFDDGSWKKVRETDTKPDNLTASVSPAVRVIETLKAKKYIVTPKGDKVIDFGQNITGRERVRLRGNPGDTIRIYHAEVLDKHGEFYTQNLRKAKALSTYIISGEQEEWLAPQFAFYGFRYIKIEGLRGDPDPDDFLAEAISSDLPKRGTFTTSDPEINQLQSNIVWGMVDNYVDIPTDCPQRDERLGWTGDAQMFFRTATFNRDVQTFFSKWLADLTADQEENGAVRGVIPRTHTNRISAGWADAATIIPWQHYMAYGDIRVLERQYPSMKKWVDYISSVAENDLWNKGNSYGDWVFFSYTDDRDGRSAVTIRPLIQQCFYAHSTRILARTARLLGKKEDADFYDALLERVVKAFRNEYVTPGGMLVSDTQTAYTLALMFDLLPDEQRRNAVERLVDNINQYGHITTGFIGTPYICHVLSRFGQTDLAYQLLLNRKIPSWIYPITMGATTIWERWNSMLPDGSIPDNGMNSFNHYAYGAIGDWLYREVAGLQESSPGYRNIVIRPQPNTHFTSIEAEYMTPYGRALSAWNRKDGTWTMKVVIPVNTTADIYIPSDQSDSIYESGRPINGHRDITYVGREGGYAHVRAGSGNYEFSIISK